VTSPSISELIEQARVSAQALVEFGGHLFRPTIRLGITGLSRAGKTVFLTALVHGLLRGGRFPVFEALATGRLARAHLAPQPDDAVPRFDYETHVCALVEEHNWPASTRHISELRVVIEYQSHNGAARTLTLDIVDYPGEWLLDLPLLARSYEQWSAESLALSREHPRRQAAAQWQAHLRTLDPTGPADEQAALTAARLFTDYLRSCRDEPYGLSMLPPGRFLMPGELAGSPALTFAPLDVPNDGAAPEGSLWAMMRRRFEAYKNVVVRPFFREHFSRLDRQIVLVDALAAFNAGTEAVCDLERTLAGIFDCFRVGRTSLLGKLFSPRIDRILFAATKADHLHHASHDRLEAILKRLTDRAIARAKFEGAQVDVIALAAVRATREASVECGGERLPSILGIPAAGQVIGRQTFDGATEAAVFPGDLPADPGMLFERTAAAAAAHIPHGADVKFLRFRPPALETTATGTVALPHIRLDRALQFLIGDRLA
jgi:predicted YcjX-like family ATPase